MYSRRPGRRGAHWAFLLVMLSGPACAQDEPDTWVLSAGGNVDDEDGYRFDVGASWLPADSTSVTALAGAADTSTDFNDFTSKAASLGVDHSFGGLGVSAELRWWGDSELFESTTVAGSAYLEREGWRFALRGELRESDFEEFGFNTVIPVRGVLVPVSGRARCTLDNSGYGISLSHTGKAWSVLLAGTQYSYSDTDCDLTGVSLPPQVGNLPPISREIFRRIATTVLERGARLLGSQLTRENGFLEYSVGGALAFRSGMRTFGLDYFHDREEFAGLEADTVIGSFTFPVSGRLDLELRLGATDSDLAGTVSFVGLTLFAFLGE